MKLSLLLVSTDAVLDVVTRKGKGAAYSTGAARDIVESQARRKGVAPGVALDALSGWTNGYVLFSPAPTPVTAHLKGRHPQESHGGDGVSSGLDKLKLAGRIRLGPGEKLTSSSKLPTSRGSDNQILQATVDTPSGRQTRLGLVLQGDAGKWRAANHGGTALFDEQQVSDLHNRLVGAEKAAQKWEADWPARSAAIEALPPSQQDWSWLDEEFVEGEMASQWGDLLYIIGGTGGDEPEWKVTLAMRPPDASPDWDWVSDATTADLGPREFRALILSLQGN